jgi:hypothetical protein
MKKTRGAEQDSGDRTLWYLMATMILLMFAAMALVLFAV